MGAATVSGIARNLSASGTASRMKAPTIGPGQALGAAQDDERRDEDGLLEGEASSG